MEGPFINRQQEIQALDAFQSRAGLIVLYGRRRLGKTRLLTEWLRAQNGVYSQAIEGSSELQRRQTYDDLASRLDTAIPPRSWTDLFSLLDAQRQRLIICLDEFPYLVQSDPSLPSILQRWWDHRKNRNIVLILCGSSRRMMHHSFLRADAPLYGRADKIIRMQPMGYSEFCEARDLPKREAGSFAVYSMVGGIPKYWELLPARVSASRAATELYFGFAAYMENEPRRLLTDEQVAGMGPWSVLEAIGRGAEKPSEIAGRLGMPQTHLSKIFHQLMEASLIRREVPFGQSERNPKNVLYKIDDPALRFWFKVYSPHKSRWAFYSRKEKEQLIALHASTVFEDSIRGVNPGARRYWERTCEFDMIHERQDANGQIRTVVSEIKFTTLTPEKRKSIRADLERRWTGSQISSRIASPVFEVVDVSVLARRPT